MCFRYEKVILGFSVGLDYLIFILEKNEVVFVIFEVKEVLFFVVFIWVFCWFLVFWCIFSVYMF